MTAPRLRVLGVIPARLGSTRLPRKPLHPLAGRPLIEWVWRRISRTPLFDRVVIATDSEEVSRACARFGARVELTDPAHPSGTDRVAEVAARPEFQGYPVIVNVQGDEPFIGEDQLAPAVRMVAEEDWEVATVVTRIHSVDDWLEPSVVKVVRSGAGAALYFSRAPIPFVRDGPPDFASGAFLRHIGIYCYRRDALFRWVATPEGMLERLERLEQLRALAAGIRLGVAEVPPTPGGVDTPEDAARVEAVLRAGD